jgi:dihydroorotate dehydrogenase (fumarate)
MSSSSSSYDPLLSVELAGIRLPTCLYNASGPRSGTAEALRKVADSASGAVLTKSATLLPQNGNPQPRTYHAAIASFNSEGLPNNGIDYYISMETIEAAMSGQDDQKPYLVSLSGKTLADNIEMIKRIAKAPTLSSIAGIELNLACPNVIGKPIIAYDFEQMDTILTQVATTIRHECQTGINKFPPLGVKLPPYFDFLHYQSAADVLNRHKDIIRYVATINTVGNALAIDGAYAEAPWISSNQGFAGMSGPAVKYIALANVRKLRQLLDASIDIVGVGGIQSGQDVFDMILAGATCCQTATTHWKEGPDCFDRILRELREIMIAKGYRKNVAEFRNQLKPWSKEGAAKARSATTTKTTTIVTAANPTPDNLGDTQTFQRLSMLFAIIAAILLADKYTNVKLLPSE